MLNNVTLRIDGKELKITGGVDVSYEPDISVASLVKLANANKPIQVMFEGEVDKEAADYLKNYILELQKIDFSDLQQEVQEYWDRNEVEYFYTETQSGSNIPPGGFTEFFIKDEYQDILDNPLAMIEELGFDSISAYINDKRVQEDAQTEVAELLKPQETA